MSEYKSVDYVQTTPFSFHEKLRARLWVFVNSTLFRWSPWFFNSYRVFLLNSFGARVSKFASVSNLCQIRYPWRLTMGDFSSLGEGAYVSCLAEISISDYAVIGQFSILETGSHNIRDRRFSLITKPITIGTGAWVGMRAMILGGITVGDFAVIGAGSVCRESVSPYSVVFGNPCRFSKMRLLE